MYVIGTFEKYFVNLKIYLCLNWAFHICDTYEQQLRLSYFRSHLEDDAVAPLAVLEPHLVVAAPRHGARARVHQDVRLVLHQLPPEADLQQLQHLRRLQADSPQVVGAAGLLQDLGRGIQRGF